MFTRSVITRFRIRKPVSDLGGTGEYKDRYPSHVPVLMNLWLLVIDRSSSAAHLGTSLVALGNAESSNQEEEGLQAQDHRKGDHSTNDACDGTGNATRACAA